MWLSFVDLNRPGSGCAVCCVGGKESEGNFVTKGGEMVEVRGGNVSDLVKLCVDTISIYLFFSLEEAGWGQKTFSLVESWFGIISARMSDSGKAEESQEQ